MSHSQPATTSREPTRHEQRAGQSWDDSYREGPAPWDIGRPQRDVVKLTANGVFRGHVLDAGCGTGEHSLLLAEQGLRVTGFDVAATAVALAQDKARERNLHAEFLQADALNLQTLAGKFDTVLDCALFHAFEGEEQSRYATSLAAVTLPGAKLYVLCFSNEGESIGPHPVSRADLERAFRPETGWQIESIAPAILETRMHENGVSAWLATVHHTVPFS